jgi:histone H3/H4
VRKGGEGSSSGGGDEGTFADAREQLTPDAPSLPANAGASGDDGDDAEGSHNAPDATRTPQRTAEPPTDAGKKKKKKKSKKHGAEGAPASTTMHGKGLAGGKGVVHARKVVSFVRHEKSNKFRRKNGNIELSSLRKLARKGGIKRIAGMGPNEDGSDAVIEKLKAFLTPVIRDAIEVTQYARCKTVTLDAVKYSLKHNGHPIYF